MYILIVEDDPIQYDFIENSLQNLFLNKLIIKRISTESEFIEKFGEISANKPDLIIMDVMLRWGDPAQNMKLPPKEILDEGFYRAGIRCVKMLVDNSETQNIQIIIYSVLDKEDLEDDLKNLPNVKYIIKDFEATKFAKLINLIN